MSDPDTEQSLSWDALESVLRPSMLGSSGKKRKDGKRRVGSITPKNLAETILPIAKKPRPTSPTEDTAPSEIIPTRGGHGRLRKTSTPKKTKPTTPQLALQAAANQTTPSSPASNDATKPLHVVSTTVVIRCLAPVTYEKIQKTEEYTLTMHAQGTDVDRNNLFPKEAWRDFMNMNTAK